MSTERDSVKVKVRSADLHASKLIDRIGKDLLDHLCGCKTCAAIFVDQAYSLADAGCIEGMRIVSESQVAWGRRKANLALRHVTDETLDDYVFNRLASEETEALEHHASVCPQCAKALWGQQTLINCIRAVVRDEGNASSHLTVIVNVRFPDRALNACVMSRNI